MIPGRIPVRSGNGCFSHIAGRATALMLLASALGWAQSSTPRPAIQRASDAEIKKHVDREWLRQNMSELLGHWVEASFYPNGFIQENLDRQWKPYGEQREATVNGQGRQLYTMAIGYEYLHDKRYLDAFVKGDDFLQKMHDDKFGGYFTRVGPDLKVISDNKDTSVAFVIFANAHAARAFHDPRYEKIAMDAWHEVKATIMRPGSPGGMAFNRDFTGPGIAFGRAGANGPGGGGRGGSGGGFAGAPGGGRGGSGGRGGQGQAAQGERPVDVHMYEALMALYEQTGSKELLADLQHQWDLIDKTYNYEVGFLPEGFGGNATNFNTGHLFEWAWQLSRSVELGAPQKFIDMGNRELDLGLKVAYNKPDGGIWMNADINGNVARKYMIWWNQAEILRATAHYAILHGRSDLWPYFDQSLKFLKANFLDAQYGGWFEGVIPGSPREALGERAYIKGAVDGPEFGSYHQTSMLFDLLRITEAGYQYPKKFKQ